ncbi:uncharacterized protein Tco025E_03940 [Trypanosoma conorhini]|uniref:Uncharacterized protein n=1 Tax=Trypanosoma conorhini TaxID=83891 RepID=A0A422PQH2_9TRYP|nr:uncharacterized protein Tco025E_03940 [Trypanosoma conorhini]RNF19974.1 hypothetical protein Tco025E_03940 [Trypanosoma conorhini]
MNSAVSRRCALGVRLRNAAVGALQRRGVVLGRPTPLLWCNPSGELPLSIPQLREQLRRQTQDGAPRMQTLDTEGRLVLTLARSPRPEDRAEALEHGEALWRELQEPSSPLPMSSRTGVRMALCTSMRRCAMVSRRRELADVWTERFAQRHNIRPEDFMTGPGHREGEVLGWRAARPRAKPGTGIDEDDLAADAAEEEEQQQRSAEKRQSQQKRELSPLQQFRRDVYMDHPMMQRAFKRGVAGPGPRYTGD